MRWEGSGENHSSYTSLLSVPSHGQVFLASGAFTLAFFPLLDTTQPICITSPLLLPVLSLLARAPTDSHTFATLTPVPAVKGWKGRDMSVLLARESPLSSAVPANRSHSAICGRNGSPTSQTSFAEAGSTRGAGRNTVINSLRY